MKTENKGVIIMKPINTQKEYQEYVDKKSPNSPILKNCFNAFWVGGFICTIGQFIMEICKRFGCRIRNLRVAQGMSQEVLAQKSGLHRTYIGGVERGERNISLINIEKIARALNLTLVDIVDGL